MDYFCGSSTWPKWIRKILSSFGAGKFCKPHDEKYQKAEGTQEEADKQMYLDFKTGNCVNRYIQGPVYYIAVKKLGHKRWGKNES